MARWVRWFTELKDNDFHFFPGSQTVFLPEDIIRTGLIYSIELDHGTYRLNFLINYMEQWKYLME